MFHSLGRRLTAQIGLAITLGFIAVVVFFAYVQQKNVLSQNERAMRKVTESVIGGVEAMMLSGHADAAELYASRLKSVADVVAFRIMRKNGLEAFKDNETIHKVNEVRGDEDFSPRDQEAQVRVLEQDDARLGQALHDKRHVLYYGEAGHRRTLTFLWPILNDEKCQKCHGKTEPVRGVLELTTSLAAVDDQVRSTWQQAGLIMVSLVVVLLLVLTVVLRRSVVRPIVALSRAMGVVSEGDLSKEVPVMGQDELARMAISFNTMIGELRESRTGLRREEDKLQTVIHSSRDGIVVTGPGGQVVLVNPAAERLLGRSSAQIAAAGFEHLLGDPARLNSLLARPASAAEMFIYNERFLGVIASEIRLPDGRLLGRTALIRDMTDAKRMEKALLELSNTDGLTGLANRRMLDESLAAEVGRAAAHARPLSILMFDVDHFKKFNDDHGHDQGDRVLQEVARCARELIRNVDLACRYGGEEFLLILAETAADGARVVAERLRERVQDMRVDGLKVTISIGVADVALPGADRPERLIELADEAMYVAKRAGRNRVVVAKPGVPAAAPASTRPEGNAGG